MFGCQIARESEKRSVASRTEAIQLARLHLILIETVLSESALSGIYARAWAVWWLCRRVSVQESIEPVDLPVQAFDQVFGFARARQVVILAREDDQFRLNSEML